MCIGLIRAPPNPSLRHSKISLYTKAVYTFTLDERYPAFVNDTSTEKGTKTKASGQANNVRDTTGFWASGLYRATIPLAQLEVFERIVYPAKSWGVERHACLQKVISG